MRPTMERSKRRGCPAVRSVRVSDFMERAWRCVLGEGHEQSHRGTDGVCWPNDTEETP
jgi:hypothetical protein